MDADCCNMQSEPYGTERMPKPKNTRSPQKRAITIPYRQSSHFVSVTADGNVVSGRHDDFGSQIHILFTKLETSFKSEVVPTEVIDNVAKQSGTSTFNMEEMKTMLCSVSMRPDHALGMISSIVMQLMQMPQHLRDKYNIPPFELMIPQEEQQQP